MYMEEGHVRYLPSAVPSIVVRVTVAVCPEDSTPVISVTQNVTEPPSSAMSTLNGGMNCTSTTEERNKVNE